MNRGGAGARALNIELQAALNAAGEEQVERFGWTFAPGDKVMQIENDYDKDVYNGDIGTVEGVDANEGELTAGFDGRRVTYGFGELDRLVLAYAATIHKSQGSEYPAVVIPVLTQHYAMLQRNLLYTGITRGKRSLCSSDAAAGDQALGGGRGPSSGGSHHGPDRLGVAAGRGSRAAGGGCRSRCGGSCRCSRRSNGPVSSRDSESRRRTGAVGRPRCPAFVAAALRRHRTRQLEQQLAAGPRWRRLGLVFTSLIGTPMDRGRLHKSFKEILRAAGLPDIRCYDLRHMAATLLLAQGVDPRTIMETLGHSRISMTMDIYAHVMPTLRLGAAGGRQRKHRPQKPQ